MAYTKWKPPKTMLLNIFQIIKNVFWSRNATSSLLWYTEEVDELKFA